MKHLFVLPRTLATLALVSMASPLAAHEFWIDTDPPRPAAGEEISANLRVGQDLSGTILPYLDTMVKSMSHASPQTSRPLGARLGDRPAISGLTVLDEGLHIISVETHPSYIVFATMPEFEEYLVYEGLAEIADLHRQRGLPDTEIAEEYIRNARALLQVGSPGEADIDRPTGMPFEIVVAGTPFADGQGFFTVRLEWQGVAVPGVQIALFHLRHEGSAPGDTVRVLARTDQDGSAEFPKVGPGKYLLSAVRMDPVDGPGSVVWQSHWASLSFDIEDPR